MASEITFSGSLSMVKTGLTISGTGSVVATLAGNTGIGTVQNIGTSTEAIAMGDVATPGYLFLKNQDATNYIQIGLTNPVSAGDAFLTLLAGEFAIVPTRQTSIYAIAVGGACDLQVVLTEL